jgi:hypothetical protein
MVSRVEDVAPEMWVFGLADVQEMLNQRLWEALLYYLNDKGFIHADLVSDRLDVLLGEDCVVVREASLRASVLWEIRDTAKRWRAWGGAAPAQREEVEQERAVLLDWLREIDELLAMPDLPA